MRQCTSARPRAIWRWKSLAQLADRRLPAAMTNVTSVSQLSLLPLSALIHLRNAGTLAASASEAVSDQGRRRSAQTACLPQPFHTTALSMCSLSIRLHAATEAQEWLLRWTCAC